MMVFCGEFVVVGVAGVEFKHHVFRVLKTRHVFELYFRAGLFQAGT
jgi:hypothetical protein